MSFKPFYIHRYHQPGKLPNRHTRGFTAFVSPINGDNQHVQIQASLCSPKDQFSRKLGRQHAETTTAEVIRKRDLPNILALLDRTRGVESSEQNFMYTLKYIV